MKEIIRKTFFPALLALFFLSSAWAGQSQGSSQQSQQPQPPPKPVTATLSVNPASIAPGQSATLTWSTENADEVTLEGGGKVATNGSQSVSPTQTTTYRLIATGKAGRQEATARVTVNAPQSVQTPPQQTQPKPAQPSAFSLDDVNTPPPVSTKGEDDAYKAAMDAKANDVPRRIQLGEEFTAKYPQSRYLESVLSAMTLNYLIAGNTPKAISTGDKALGLNPDDVLVLALMSQALTRVWNPNAPDAQAQLDKAEKYGKHTIELTPNLQKPAGTSDQDFTAANNKRLSMAHSGLGLASFRRHKYAEAIPDLEEAVKIVPDPDPVNYYVLGIAEFSTQRFNDAVTTFTKCIEIPGQLQGECKARLEDAKKQAATHLSAPK